MTQLQESLGRSRRGDGQDRVAGLTVGAFALGDGLDGADWGCSRGGGENGTGGFFVRGFRRGQDEKGGFAAFVGGFLGGFHCGLLGCEKVGSSDLWGLW